MSSDSQSTLAVRPLSKSRRSGALWWRPEPDKGLKGIRGAFKVTNGPSSDRNSEHCGRDVTRVRPLRMGGPFRETCDRFEHTVRVHAEHMCENLRKIYELKKPFFVSTLFDPESRRRQARRRRDSSAPRGAPSLSRRAEQSPQVRGVVALVRKGMWPPECSEVFFRKTIQVARNLVRSERSGTNRRYPFSRLSFQSCEQAA